MGLVCQHDFERILAPEEHYPLIIPSSIHRFWHLKQQDELEVEAKQLALKYVRNNATVGTFFTHYPLDKLPVIPPQADDSALMPMNEYLEPHEIIREMSPDAVIIQEPISRPQYVKAQAKKKRKRAVQDIKQGRGPAEDIVRPHAKSGRMETAAEVVNRQVEERRKAEATAARKISQGNKPRGCGHCSGSGHNIRRCPKKTAADAAAIVKTASQASGNVPGTNIFRNVSQEAKPQHTYLEQFPSRPQYSQHYPVEFLPPQNIIGVPSPQQFLGVSPFAARAYGNLPQQYYAGSQPGPSSAPIAPPSQLGRYYQ